MSDSPTTFTIVGAGLGGTLMAVYLGQAGYAVDVYEGRPDPRAAGAVGGRSINLAISTRAIHALKEVGVADEVLRSAVAMRGRMMHGVDGKLTFQPYGTRPEHVINSVSRGGLNMALLDAADRVPTVRTFFSHRLQSLDLEAHTAAFVHSDGRGTAIGLDAGPLIGADGAFSAVRGHMQRLDRFDYQQSYLEYGYKELTIPPAEGGGFRMERNALHIWPRGGYMMIALPNVDGSFTCTLFWPFTGPNGFDRLRTDRDVMDYFRAEFGDAVEHMPTLVEDYHRNPTSSLVTIRSGPWYHRDTAVLLGDACHAVVPFYGQGANAAFEDCTILHECIRRRAPDWEAAFADYYREHKRHCDALADLALRNFEEMRDHVASRVFLLRKRTEKSLHRLFPRWYVPLYSMVSFSRVPYADAIRKARVQDQVVAWAAVAIVVATVALVGLLWS